MADARRARAPDGLRVLATAPWRRAPLLLRRSPAVLLAVLVSGLVLGAAAAATPLFVSSTANAALARQLEQLCVDTTGVTVLTQGTAAAGGGALLARRDRAVRQAAAGTPHLGPASLTITGTPLSLAGAAHPSQAVSGRLLYRQGLLERVRKLRVAGGAGVWLPSEAAGFAGVEAGDTLLLTSNGRTARSRVAGIYKDLNRLPETPAWCGLHNLLQPPDLLANPPPPLLLVDRQTGLTLSRRLQDPLLTFTWNLPLAGPATLSRAHATAAGIPRLRDRLSRPGGPFRSPRDPGFYPADPGRAAVSSELPVAVRRADALLAAVRGAIGPVAIAGTVVALLLVGAAGGYWVERRRGEVGLLAAKGVGPAAIALKASLEMALPALAGALGGWAVALGLVRLLGPSELLDGSARLQALARTGVATAAGVTLLGLVAAARTRAMTERGLGVRAGLAGRLPVELAVLALAAWSFRRLSAHGAPVAAGLEAPRIDLLLLAFPLLFLTGTVGLALRLLGPAAARLRTAGGAWPHAVYLAARRLAASARLALLLLGASALSIGVLVYAATLTLSVRATLEAKARMFVGSDVSALLLRDGRVPDGVRGTTVARLNHVDIGGVPTDVLAVDPATFAAGVHWDRSFARRPLRALLGDLARPRPGAPAPVLLAGPSGLPAELDLEASLLRRAGTVTLPVQVVERVRAFPGMRGGPLLVIDKRALAPLGGDGLEHHLWARGAPDAVLRAAEAGGLRVAGQVLSTREVLDVSSFLAVSWTFGFLQAFGVLTGLITLAGLLLYVETRQRARQVMYVLARRMGLSRAAHRGSVLVEVGATLLAGFAAGAALSLVAARLVYRRLDALPSIPPAPRRRCCSPTGSPPGPRSARPTASTPRRCCAVPRDAPAVACRGLVKEYRNATGAVRALRGVDADFPAGRLTAVVGPSGSGKTSLLRILACVDRPTGGSISIGGVELSGLRARARRRIRRRLVGYVLQQPSDNLLPYLTVREHLRLAAALRGGPAGGDPDEADRLLGTLGLDRRAGFLPEQLSGGEQQRLAFAAAVIGGPALVVADEPTAELDHESAARLMRAVLDLRAEGASLLLASHDQAVVRLADRVVGLRDGAVSEEAW